jgi:hypothetical protein
MSESLKLVRMLMTARSPLQSSLGHVTAPAKLTHRHVSRTIIEIPPGLRIFRLDPASGAVSGLYRNGIVLRSKTFIFGGGNGYTRRFPCLCILATLSVACMLEEDFYADSSLQINHQCALNFIIQWFH